MALLSRLFQVLCVLVGQDAPKDFERAFKSTEKKPRSIEQRQQALDLLAGRDDPATGTALVDAWIAVETEVVAVLTQRDEVQETLSRMVKGQEFRARSFETGAMASYKQLCAKSTALAAKAESLRGLQQGIAARLGEIKNETTVSALLERVIGAKNLPFLLQQAVAELAADLGGVLVDPLIRAVVATRKGEEAALLLRALARTGTAAQPALEAALEWLKNGDTNVREQAAAALAAMAHGRAIAPLIDQLLTEPEGISQRRMAASLEILTGQEFGTSSDSWKRWYTDEGFKLAESNTGLGAGVSSLEESLTVESKARGGYYHGLPQEGRAIVYVIDCSGSMVVSATDPKYENKIPVDAGKESRMEVCKQALSGALGKLPSDAKFTIVCFNDLPHPYEEHLVESKPAEIKKAKEWVAKLSAAHTTNIHDSLEHAFKLAGRGAFDQYYSSAVDTIFLLTDGSPTTPDGNPDSTQKILDAVKRWNPQQSVILHTIGIGKEINEPFLRQLAKDHKGRFVKHFQ